MIDYLSVRCVSVATIEIRTRDREAEAAMEIRSVRQFLDYWDGVRARTRRVIACIPPQHLEWTPRTGNFTLGDLARHLATIERYMYAGTVAPATRAVIPAAAAIWRTAMTACWRTSTGWMAKPKPSSVG